MSQGGSLERTCGQLLVCGFAGTEAPQSLLELTQQGFRGGVILFSRNLDTLEQARVLCGSILRNSSAGAPPVIGIDEEGGRVVRLPAPAPHLPSMRRLGSCRDPALTEAAGRALGALLGALGVSCNFAPVLDVDSNPDNPVIGDRAFSRDPGEVSRHGRAFARGLQAEGVFACGKHFPGHGDTHRDSHLELPTVTHERTRLAAVELAPFAFLARSDLAAMMTAHVVYEALDATHPATLSAPILTQLLKGDLGFGGMLFSDDLEMGALARSHSIEESAVLAVQAGCDAVLICHQEDWQHRAHAALVREAEQSRAFRARCEDALARSLRVRRRWPPRQTAPEEGRVALPRLQSLIEQIHAHE